MPLIVRAVGHKTVGSNTMFLSIYHAPQVYLIFEARNACNANSEHAPNYNIQIGFPFWTQPQSLTTTLLFFNQLSASVTTLQHHLCLVIVHQFQFVRAIHGTSNNMLFTRHTRLDTHPLELRLSSILICIQFRGSKSCIARQVRYARIICTWEDHH